MALSDISLSKQLLDCTLRDGHYKVSFSAVQTGLLCHALAQAGIQWIEIGQGLGLGASEAGHGHSAETDLAFAQAAQQALQGTQAQWGMFAIPGIVQPDHLRMAADAGMGFVRLGINPEQQDQLPLYAQLARRLGLITFCNVMKSYTIPPEVFARLAERVTDEGCDGMYLVDSAGGMRPDEVSFYLQAAKQACPHALIGFHGHNNLGLSVANALAAWQQGANLVDVTLRGIGRSAGNTPAEQLACVLARLEPDFPLDPLMLMGLSQRFIVPLLPADPLDDVAMTCGLAHFHSSYLPQVEAAAQRNKVDVKKLIRALGFASHSGIEIDQMAATLAAQMALTP